MPEGGCQCERVEMVGGPMQENGGGECGRSPCLSR